MRGAVGVALFDIKSSFVEVGLLPASTLKDPAVDAAVAAARAAANPKAEGEVEDPPSPNPTNSAT
jgi:hypothetical protein